MLINLFNKTFCKLLRKTINDYPEWIVSEKMILLLNSIEKHELKAKYAKKHQS